VDTERRAIEAERRSRELEERVNHLLSNLEERDQSLSLLSQLYTDQLKKVVQAEAHAEAEAKARSNMEALLKQSLSDDSLKKEGSTESLKIKKRRDSSDQKPGTPEPDTKPQRRKSYVRKTKSKAEDPKLVNPQPFFFFAFFSLFLLRLTPPVPFSQKHLDELEEELGMKKDEPKEKKEKLKKKRGSVDVRSESPVPTSTVRKDKDKEKEKEKEKEKTEEKPPAPTPAPVIPGPKGYVPFIPVERAASIHKNVSELWAHLPEIKPLLDKISERERSRQEIIYELVATEEVYISDLELIIRVRVA